MAEADFEKEVGIVEYLSDTAKFKGILKQRFSDFVVREVSKKGTVCTLTSCNGKELEAELFTVEDVSANRSPEEVCAAFMEELKGIAGAAATAAPTVAAEPTWLAREETINAFVLAAIKKDPSGGEENTIIRPDDKASRTAIHQLIRKHLTKWMDSETVEIEGAHHIRMLPRKGRDGTDGGGLKRKRIEWPVKVGNYLQFTLMKENVDTMSAIAIINKNMRLKPGAIEYNGTKDKRGITAQKCTLFRRRPSDFTRINNYKLNPILRIGDFEYVDEPAKLGSLSGNRFDIVLRAIDLQHVDTVNAACSALARNGFINYYGLQRFGKGAAKSHMIGKELLKSNWEGCVRLLFTVSDFDQPFVKEGKELFQAGEYKEALKKIPDKLHAEKTVLHRLVQRPTDFAGAYGAVSKHIRLMCAHAYQSYIWNKAASMRIKTFGLCVVEGDIVAADGFDVDAGELDDEIEGGMSAVDASASTEGAGSESSKKTAKTSESHVSAGSGTGGGKDKASPIDVHIVTAEDVASARYSMNDVLLPLPGHEIVLPTHSVGEYYGQLLAEDGLSMETYATCNITYRMRGTYRKVVQKATGLNWSVLSYDDTEQELLETEISQFRCSSEGTPVNPETTVIVANGAAEGRYRALKLQFFLPPGTYATMLLRELTKESTESMFQAQLSSNVFTFAAASADTKASVDVERSAVSATTTTTTE